MFGKKRKKRFTNTVIPAQGSVEKTYKVTKLVIARSDAAISLSPISIIDL